MKNEKTRWFFVFQKYGKFWGISPGYFWRVPPPFQNLTFNFLQTDTGETFMESLLNGLQQHYTQFESLNTNSTSTSYPDCYVVLMCDLYPHVSRNFEKPFSWRNIFISKKVLYLLDFYPFVTMKYYNLILDSHMWMTHQWGKTEIYPFQKKRGKGKIAELLFWLKPFRNVTIVHIMGKVSNPLCVGHFFK